MRSRTDPAQRWQLHYFIYTNQVIDVLLTQVET